MSGRPIPLPFSKTYRQAKRMHDDAARDVDDPERRVPKDIAQEFVKGDRARGIFYWRDGQLKTQSEYEEWPADSGPPPPEDK